MSRFDDYLKRIKRGSRALLKETLQSGVDEAREIVEAHLKQSEGKLRRWTALLAKGELTESEFKLLVNNQVSLGRMKLRTVEVIGKRSAIDLRDGLRDLLVDAAFAVFL